LGASFAVDDVEETGLREAAADFGIDEVGGRLGGVRERKLAARQIGLAAKLRGPAVLPAMEDDLQLSTFLVG